jgi:tetratricopeptide (TPR) repeat protein
MKNAPASRRSRHNLTRRELTASFVVPTVLFLAIWVAGLLVYVIAPERFVTAVSLLIALGLFLFLIYYTRRARFFTRLAALLLAIPALVGITISLTSGNTPPLVIGVSLTILLLAIQRFLETPLSYRRAYRAFAQGDYDLALELTGRTIALRPDFGESFQLRALIHIANGNLARAHQDAQMAIAQGPEQPPAHSVLGQVHLAQGEYEAAAAAFDQALAYDPDNAVYHYYYGLCHYRLGHYQLAAEALHTAVHRGLPRGDFELLALFYLGRSLEQLGRTSEAEERFKQMAHFGARLAILRAQYDHLPNYPHLAQMKLDLTAVAERLKIVISNQ